MNTHDNNGSTNWTCQDLLVHEFELYTQSGAAVSSTIGSRLKEERQRLGLSQTRIGEIGAVGKTTQINYEKDARSPDAAYLAAIATAGVDVLYVLTGQRTPEPEAALEVREKAVLDNYRALPEEDKAAVQRLTDALKESIKNRDTG